MDAPCCHRGRNDIPEKIPPVSHRRLRGPLHARFSGLWRSEAKAAWPVIQGENTLRPQMRTRRRPRIGTGLQ